MNIVEHIIQSTVDSVCLILVHDIYRSKTIYIKMPNGEEFPEKKDILVKQIRVRKWFKKEGIVSIEQYVTTKNTIAKNRCIVFDKYSNRFYNTFHSMTNVMTTVNNHSKTNQIGFTAPHDTNFHSPQPPVHKHRK